MSPDSEEEFSNTPPEILEMAAATHAMRTSSNQKYRKTSDDSRIDFD